MMGGFKVRCILFPQTLVGCVEVVLGGGGGGGKSRGLGQA